MAYSVVATLAILVALIFALSTVMQFWIAVSIIIVVFVICIAVSGLSGTASGDGEPKRQYSQFEQEL